MKGYFRKRGSTWSFTIDLGRDEKTGKRKQKTKSGFKTKKDAERACNELINQMNKGLYVEPSTTTLKEFIMEWMETRAKQVLRPSSYDNHLVVIESHIIPDLGDYKLVDLTPAHVQRFYSQKTKQGLSPDYIRYMHNILNKSLKHAAKWELIPKNIIELVDPPRLRDKEIQTWTLEEATEFLEYSKNHGERFYIGYLLAIYTGMRRGEILGLRWKDCNLKQAKASIRQTLYRTRQGLIFQEPKTKSSKRQISLPQTVVDALNKYRIRQNTRKLSLGTAYHDHDLIVCTEDGKPVEPRNFVRHFDRMIKESGSPKIRFHDLRHTHATILLQIGEHPKVVSERLGHSRISVTLDTYSHVLPDMQKDAAENFEKAMKKMLRKSMS
ncbi:site-specific integrase [Brevibacillus dissolubilis]|uniref:site-specific integrase n=1 Tax=Brevibacillus dissolubilis TaxID=1844116 RepID=UPI001116A7A1|nr:site-specific integrase [Brevibacillus dissolubilis]